MIDFDFFEESGFKITNYNSIDLTEVKEYLASLNPEWLFDYKLQEGAKIETIIKDFYGSTKYTDIIMLLNNREYIFGLPVVYDVLEDSVTQTIEDFYYKVFGDQFYYKHKQVQETNNLRPSLNETELNRNLRSSVITLIYPPKISIVSQKISEILKTQREMYNLLDLELEDA